MPEVSGLNLLSWIKAKKNTPVILVTGFGALLETKQADELGADDFFTKPFTYKNILRAVNKLLVPQSIEALAENIDSQFCRIPIDDFVSSSAIQINIYIKLADNRYVRVAHQGDLVPTDRVENYKAKDLDYLYAKKEDLARLVGFNMNVSKSLNANPGVSSQKKIRFLRYTAELVLENTMVKGINGRAFRQAEDFLGIMMSVVTESQCLYEVLEVLNDHSDWLYAHSLGVSMYSVMICRKLGWVSQTTLFKLGVSGLFHDIGQKEIAPELLVKNRALLTSAERKTIESHTARGKQILLDLKDLSEDILQIVYEHHEDCTGQGYPRNLAQGKIHPLAKVVAVADMFCYLAMAGPHSMGGDAQAVIQFMEQNHFHELDKAAFAALKTLIVAPPPVTEI
jgi:putative nucleotidyltransferase with HDIG domain